MERKKLLLRFIRNVNHQSSHQTPALILNRIMVQKKDNPNFEEIKLLLAYGADPTLRDASSNLSFVDYARQAFTDRQIVELCLHLGHSVASFHLLLKMFETRNGCFRYTYEGLYFTFYTFTLVQDRIDAAAILRYVSILIKHIGQASSKDQTETLDAWTYVTYLLTYFLNVAEEEKDNLVKYICRTPLLICNMRMIINITMGQEEKVLNSTKPEPSPYRVILEGVDYRKLLALLEPISENA